MTYGESRSNLAPLQGRGHAVGRKPATLTDE